VQPLSQEEARRLEELEREFIEKRKLARVTVFKALPPEVRAKIVLDRQVYDAEIAIGAATAGVAQTTEHSQLQAREVATKYNMNGFWPNQYRQAGINQLYPPGSIGHWHNGTQYQPHPIADLDLSSHTKPNDLGLTTKELERAHLDQCAEEMICEQ
jgi:hypothetical protein